MEYNFLKPPPPTKYNVLSLGSGVQSTCMALMAAKGEITPMPDFAIFADTMSEPKSVYKHLSWLELRLPFPIYKVTQGNLEDASMKAKIRQRDGKKYVERTIPLFGIKADGSHTAAIGRACTSNYKIKPIYKFLRSKCEIKRGQKDTSVTSLVGISWDEIERMRDSKYAWAQHRYPLVEMKMTRNDCKIWLKKNGYEEPPRSACYYCPFHNNSDWRDLKKNDPKDFERAVEFDKKIRQFYKDNDDYPMKVFLHSSCKPLDEVDLSTDEEKGQMTWDFKAECEGMCGV